MSLMSLRKPHISIKSQSCDTIVIVAVLVVIGVVDVVGVIDVVGVVVVVGIDVLDVRAKIPGLYLVSELRYPCHFIIVVVILVIVLHLVVLLLIVVIIMSPMPLMSFMSSQKPQFSI